MAHYWLIIVMKTNVKLCQVMFRVILKNGLKPNKTTISAKI